MNTRVSDAVTSTEVYTNIMTESNTNIGIDYSMENDKNISKNKNANSRSVTISCDTSSSSELICSGLVWHIPTDRVKETIAELDYRERGGYHR